MRKTLNIFAENSSLEIKEHKHKNKSVIRLSIDIQDVDFMGAKIAEKASREISEKLIPREISEKQIPQQMREMGF